MERNAMNEVSFTAPLPPSKNELHSVVNGRIINTTAYNRYMEQFAAKVVDLNPYLAQVPDDFFDPQLEYCITLIIYFERILSKRPVRGGTPFLQLDVQNRIEAIADAIKRLIQIDDRNYGEWHVSRRCDPENPRVEVLIRKRSAR
jgi:Holliday junction resolvase RusA-like endonuclease